MRLLRELHRPEGTCHFVGNTRSCANGNHLPPQAKLVWTERQRSQMLPRLFPEGTSGEGGTRLREAPGPRCSITLRTSHVPAGLAAHVISRQWDEWRCGATILERIAEVGKIA
jgi:hypothetical protein